MPNGNAPTYPGEALDWQELETWRTRILSLKDDLSRARYVREEIVREAHGRGASQTLLASMTGLTRQRIQQICGKDGER